MAKRDDLHGLSESLRSAIDRTFAATADSASETRGRAQDLLDEVAKRGQEASTLVTQRVIEAIQDRRLASGEDLRRLEAKIDRLGRRLESLEGAKAPRKPAKAKPAKGSTPKAKRSSAKSG